MLLSSLKAVADNRNDILLAEAAALLHDVGKFCDLHVESVSGGRHKWSNAHAYKVVLDDPRVAIRLNKAAEDIPKGTALSKMLRATSPKAADFIPDDAKRVLAETRVRTVDQDYSMAELIMLGIPAFASHQRHADLLEGKDGWLPALLGVCHSEAHVDKEEPQGGEQEVPDILSSTAFGFETRTFVLGDPLKSLDASLATLDLSDLPSREVLQGIAQQFARGLGDTRRPINEVTLSDWASTVAALFKPAVAGAIITGTKPGIRGRVEGKKYIIDHDIRWRLLRVNFDTLTMYARAMRVADFLGYKKRVDDVCYAIKRLVEDEYPIGSEVYRDATGIYFTFPDIPLPPDLERAIRELVEGVEPELAPRIAVGGAEGATAGEQIKEMLAQQRAEARKAIAQPLGPENAGSSWQVLWRTAPTEVRQVCPVCRMRPMKESAEACDHCLRRRHSRIQHWRQRPDRTIWMDEIADHNGRVALVVGRFGLDDWLSGDLVKTMLVSDGKGRDCLPKPKSPSLARLRRVWKTTERFWTDTVEEEILLKRRYAQATKNPGLRNTRLAVHPDRRSGWRESVPYDGTIGGRPVSVLWKKDGQCFITISNLQMATGNAGDVGELVTEWKDRGGERIELCDPDNPRQPIGFTIEDLAPAPGRDGEYVPCLPLLACPDQFLALVPACDSVAIAEDIWDEYCSQFGKVRNRLPIFLGLVFFPRKMPLSSVIDTARRILETPLRPTRSTISGGVRYLHPDANGWPREVEIPVAENGNTVLVKVRTVMGDNSTQDLWYPYWRVEGRPTDRRRWFHGFDGEHWVHATDLKEGDVVQFAPSRFAYLFLEHTAQRFRFDSTMHGIPPDELAVLRSMWSALSQDSNITDTALHGILTLLDVKGDAWGWKSAELLRLAETALEDAGLFRRRHDDGSPFKNVVTPEDVSSGRFARCIDLYLRILRLRVKEDRNGR